MSTNTGTWGWSDPFADAWNKHYYAPPRPQVVGSTAPFGLGANDGWLSVAYGGKKFRVANNEDAIRVFLSDIHKMVAAQRARELGKVTVDAHPTHAKMVREESFARFVKSFAVIEV